MNISHRVSCRVVSCRGLSEIRKFGKTDATKDATRGATTASHRKQHETVEQLVSKNAGV
ncbi:hypothetical protein PLEOSDRAFT_1077316 [Pleurotus ostreatus PC15]|uniref:Uncharacterized protein n=1 Tax=Pleurotus ostreatus (strain PC15) TaxID=1137138 RepID=A0A067NEL0_PLEO1|nr:hypothetical protein PLEOSDRAFT_1077316 [Pleurotus ostreatus PC15]